MRVVRSIPRVLACLRFCVTFASISPQRDNLFYRVPCLVSAVASSSVGRSGARAPPPADQLATFYKLVDKRVTAAILCRHARNAELSAQAALQAKTLFGDDSLVMATLRYSESNSLSSLASEASGAEYMSLTGHWQCC